MIGLVHSTGTEKRQQTSTLTSPIGKVDQNCMHNKLNDCFDSIRIHTYFPSSLLDILEHSLHQLLRQVHLNNVGQPVPHPSSAPLGPTKRRRLAGPHAYDRDELLLMTKRFIFVS